MLKRLLRAVGIVAVVGGIPGGLTAQAPNNPTFETASVKLSNGEGPASLGFLSGGLLRATNITARELIRTAYRLQGFQIVGGPSWITSDKFDLMAKAAGNPVPSPGDPPGPPQAMFLMLRSLLAERFKVTVHRETRDLPVYAIVMARMDARRGPQLRPAAFDCSSIDVRNAPPPPDVFCGIRSGADSLTGKGATMGQLALNLSPRVDRIVLDRTGLTGTFDLDLAWTPVASADAASNGTSPLADMGASLFTAMQEQLGLRLESTKGPVDVLVIDHVERPTED
jgi:uncharacterized protein (TIGR03435 family)